MSNSNQCTLHIGQLCNTGSFAEVYQAHKIRSDSLQEVVAVKVLKERWLHETDLVARFWDEATLLKRLQHPNIIRSDGLYEIDGRPALVMEYVDGFDIKQLLTSSHFKFEPKAAFEAAVCVADALNAAYRFSMNQDHQSLVVLHRDIKPANIMLNRNGLIRVLDFGAAKFVDRERQGQTSVFEPGNNKYAPPQKLQGTPGDHPGDVYALGLVLVEMLLNQELPTPPLEPNQHREYIRKHLSECSFGLPDQRWVESATQTLFRMLAYEPAERLSAEQALRMLKTYEQQASGSELTQLTRRQFQFISQNLPNGPLTGQRHTLNLQAQVSETAPNPAPVSGSSNYTEATTKALQTPVSTKQTPQPSAKGPLAASWFSLQYQPFWKAAALAFVVTICSMTALLFSLQPERANTNHATTATSSSEPSAKQKSHLLSLAIDGTIRKGILISTTNDKTLVTLKRSSPEAQLELETGKYVFQVEARGVEQLQLKFPIVVSAEDLGKGSQIGCKKEKVGASCRRDGNLLSAEK